MSEEFFFFFFFKWQFVPSIRLLLRKCLKDPIFVGAIKGIFKFTIVIFVYKWLVLVFNNKMMNVLTHQSGC